MGRGEISKIKICAHFLRAKTYLSQRESKDKKGNFDAKTNRRSSDRRKKLTKKITQPFPLKCLIVRILLMLNITAEHLFRIMRIGAWSFKQYYTLFYVRAFFHAIIRTDTKKKIEYFGTAEKHRKRCISRLMFHKCNIAICTDIDIKWKRSY